MALNIVSTYLYIVKTTVKNDFLLKLHKSKWKLLIKWFEIKIKNHHFENYFKSESRDHRSALKSLFQISNQMILNHSQHCLWPFDLETDRLLSVTDELLHQIWVSCDSPFSNYDGCNLLTLFVWWSGTRSFNHVFGSHNPDCTTSTSTELWRQLRVIYQCHLYHYSKKFGNSINKSPTPYVHQICSDRMANWLAAYQFCSILQILGWMQFRLKLGTLEISKS